MVQVKQAQTYDSEGAYIRHWCPELSAVPTNMLHQPWLLTHEARRQYKVSDYPEPLVKVKAPSSNFKQQGGGGGSKAQKSRYPKRT
jgi:deoxyribodipyrimidine photo-lyase